MKFLAACLATLAFSTGAAFAQSDPPLSLAAAVNEAVDHNADVSAAMREVDVVRARRTQVALAPLQLQPSVSVTPDVPGGLGLLATAGATVSQQWLPVGNLRAATTQADFGLAAARFAVDATQRDVALQTAAAYFVLAGAQATIDIARENVGASNAFVRSATLRARAGAIGNFEVLRATVELRRVQTDLLRALAAQASARIALNTLLGRPPEVATTVIDPSLDPATIARSQTLDAAPFAPSAALDMADDAAQAIDPQRRELAAERSAQTARADASRTLARPALTVGVGFQGTRASRTGAMFVAPVLATSITLSLLDHGTIVGAAREAEAARAVLDARIVGRSREVRAHVATALADVRSGLRRSQYASHSRKAADDVLRIALYGFRMGALGSLDVLNAKTAAATARGDERQAACDVAAARARLDILLGVPLSS